MYAKLLNVVEACARKQSLKNDIFLRRTDAMWSFRSPHCVCARACVYEALKCQRSFIILCCVLCSVCFPIPTRIETRKGGRGVKKNHAHVFAIKIAHVLLMAAKQHFYSLRHGLFAFKSLGHF